MDFKIFSICTGNVCRSPIAELILAEELAAYPAVTVESAGIGALVGSGVPEPGRRLAGVYDLDASDHVARQLDTEMIRSSSLILGMAREHRRRVVELAPGAMRRTFTLRELARIADAVEDRLPQAVEGARGQGAAAALKSAVALAAAMRGTVPPPEDADDFDVIDPYRQSDTVYQQSFEQLVPAARRVAKFLSRAVSIASN